MNNEQIDTAVKALKAVQELDEIQHQDEIESLTREAVQLVDLMRVNEYGYDPLVELEPEDRE